MSLLYLISERLQDKMIKMLEKYTLHLEDTVADRTADLKAEKMKAEKLLYNILPKLVLYSVKCT